MPVIKLAADGVLVGGRVFNIANGVSLCVLGEMNVEVIWLC